MHKPGRVKIFGVPIDLGANKLGVDMGPRAIRYADLRGALRYNQIAFEDYGDLAIERALEHGPGSPDHQRALIAAVAEQLAGLVAGAIAEGFVPVVLGGDHSASIGSIAGAAQQAERLGLLWLDYHPDANTPESSPSGNIHGMTVAISLGRGYPELVNCGGRQPKLKPEDICMIGVNDIDEGEDRLLKELGVRMFTLMDIERLGVVRVMEQALQALAARCDRVHVSFDIDVLDPLIAPGTGIVSRGGLSYREISYIMKTLGEAGIVGSIDVIEVNPLVDIRNQTAELAVEMLLAALGGVFGDYQRHYLRVQGEDGTSPG